MASPKALDLGSSLSVQELAKEPMLAIPQRYIRFEEPSTPSHGSDSSRTIPIIDMNHLVLGQVDLEQENLHFACKEWGIFQLVNHGVESSVVEKLRNEVQEFYKLPLEEKMRYNRKEGDVEGYGQTILLHENQTVDWADKLYMNTNPVHRRKAHLFPELPSSLRESLECYISELQKLAMTLLGLITKALKIERGEIEEMVEDGMQSVRMTYYPPCPQPEKVMGLTAHSDATLITILLQVNAVQGLQVKRDGIWIPVNVLPDAFVINVGDVLEIFSNGLYKSIEHRATVNQEKERISIGMFFNPKFQAEVGPSSTLLNPQNPPLFKRLGMESYVRDFFGRKLDGKSFLEQMRRSAENGVHNSV